MKQNNGASSVEDQALVSDQAATHLGPSGFDPSRRVLDACCGSRMFWFDRANPDAIFIDNRKERHSLIDRSSAGGSRSLVIDPDFVADFTSLPFPDNHFAVVAFDPPHLVSNGKNGWLAKKYGKLGADWRDELRKGFSECFRVLRPDGVLVFKWNEHEIRVSEVLALAPAEPLFGNRCGRTAKSHWLVFLKPASGIEARSDETLKAAQPEGQEPGGKAETPKEPQP